MSPRFRLTDLNLTPEALIFFVGENQIRSSGSGRDDVMRLRVGHEIYEDCDGKALAILKVQAGEHVHKVEAGSETTVAINGVVARVGNSQIAIPSHQQITGDRHLGCHSLGRC